MFRAGTSLLFLASLGCPEKPAPTAEASASEKVVLVANGVPVYREDLQRLGGFVRSFFYNLSPEYAESVALVNSLLPRAVSLAHYRDRVEPLRKKMEEARERIAQGEDFDRVGREVSDYPVGAEDPQQEWAGFQKLDYLVGEWLFSLKPGEVSPPILTRHGWYLIRVMEQNFPPNRLRSTARFRAIILAFDKGPEFDRQLHRWIDEAEIRVLDADYERVVPEWVKHRAGARSWKPIEVEGK